MTIYRTFPIICALLAMFVMSPLQVSAKEPVSKAVVNITKSVARECLRFGWETTRCLTALSASNKMLAANYMAALQQQGETQASEDIKENCAAATALGGQGTLSSEVVSSALTACVNKMVDTTRATTIKPDVNHFQLILATTYCYKGSETAKQCKIVEKSLEPYSK